jgi:hypothetical protein
VISIPEDAKEHKNEAAYVSRSMTRRAPGARGGRRPTETRDDVSTESSKRECERERERERERGGVHQTRHFETRLSPLSMRNFAQYDIADMGPGALYSPSNGR